MIEGILNALTLGLPVILAITLHEAAHGYVALHYGDDTAKRAGRISLNPLRHVDFIGTLLLPAILLLTHAPFLFGYAKPVPVDFSRLRNPRKDSIFVAVAGPATNLALALVSAFLFHFLSFLPPSWIPFGKEMLTVSVLTNVTLAVFNMIPLPPLDGGRVAVGLLPRSLALPLARLEPYGFFIIFGLLVLSPFLGVSLLGTLLIHPVKFLIHIISLIAGLD